MYCANCGVELADSEKFCPLCKTRAYHPDIERKTDGRPYPGGEEKEVAFKRGGIMFIITSFFIISACVCLICDLRINKTVSWSAFSLGGLALLYVTACLPFWFKNPNPVVFSAIDFVASGGYLLLVDLITGGGWFMSFAFPVTGGAMLITVAVITLCTYLNKGHLYIFGGAFIAIGGFTMLIEFFLHITFGTEMFKWSLYPASACTLVGLWLILIAICKPLRESLEKAFFI